MIHHLIGTCRAHGHWFPVDRVHEPCPEPGCEAACDYYELIPDAKLKAMATVVVARQGRACNICGRTDGRHDPAPEDERAGGCL